MITPGQRALEAMNAYNLSLHPDSPGVSWDGLSDEGRQGWEVTAGDVREPLLGLLGEWLRDHDEDSMKIAWLIQRTREALK